MSLSTGEVAQVLIAFILLVIIAHSTAYLFERVKQPPVIGEILGGLLLGPTVLGFLLPDLQRQLISANGPTSHALGVMYQLGLLFLVYLTGTQLRGRSTGAERRTIVAVSLSGLIVPFAAGLTIAFTFDLGELSGPNGSKVALVLIFGMAVAITSIPVISRIMLDLGILRTSFARIVLTVAVLEDVVLYVVLAVVMGISGAMSGDLYGIGALLGNVPLPWVALYFMVVPVLFLVALLRYGKNGFSKISDAR
jgi:Kef-type K+ transport system membrane component KefB